MIESRQLLYFLAVARAKNFSRAAEALEISQPPLSRQIKSLEDRLDTTLFYRSSQGVELTSAGEFLAEQAPALINEMRDLERDVHAIGSGRAGVLRLGFVGTATFQLMPKLLVEIKDRLPNIEVRVSGEKLTPELENLLLKRKIDAAILRPPVSSHEIVLESFGIDDFSLAVGPHHPLLKIDGPVPFSLLAEHTIVAFQEGSAAEQITRRAANRAGFNLQIAQHAPETSTVLALVASGIGVAIVPRGSIPEPMGVLRMLDLSDGPKIGLSMAWLKDNRSPILRRLLPMIKVAALESRKAKMP
ncbi:LysR family transcriptional regulator [Corynebacterium testudinoris]|uniref:Transcriptional regulator n=1 Tax=Corynebacterium testudinoris TaxID=136857 RepID=A0A0G3H9S8_9CORY|nr:LysR family transcriptional regulator [Corynebacterium testudinoris]AKK09525.1 transcriptional regulator [Corynebacterium testudinoris]MBX8996228.1 LysR family transcriptional regulator [Corynebacterium testudinoris]